jgi:hypothetical protein
MMTTMPFLMVVGVNILTVVIVMGAGVVPYSGYAYRQFS